MAQSRSQGQTVGIVLISAGVTLGLVITAWLASGIIEGGLAASGAILGLILALLILVLPLVGAGILILSRARKESAQLARIREQRALIDIVKTRGQIELSDLVLELQSSTDQVRRDLYELVGRGLFSGYVDWDRGRLYSVEARELNGRSTCPNCGGQLQLGGKGLIKCPYCGADIFL